MPIIVPSDWDTDILAPGDVSSHVFRTAASSYNPGGSWGTVPGMSVSIALEEPADVWQLYWCELTSGDNAQVRFRRNGTSPILYYATAPGSFGGQGHMMQWIWKETPAGMHTFDVQQLRGNSYAKALGLIVLKR